MKCRYCGSNLGIEDEYCPYCGKVNDQAAGHQAVMKDYLNEFERTKTEAKVKSITAGRIGRFVVIGLMLAAIMIMGISIAINSDVENRIKKEEKRISKELNKYEDDVTATLKNLEKDRDYLALSYYVLNYRLRSDDRYDDYARVFTAVISYRAVFEDILNILDGFDGYEDKTDRDWCYDAAIYISDWNSYVGGEFWNDSPDSPMHRGEHGEFLKDIKKDAQDMVQVYFDLTDVQATSMWDMDRETLGSMLYEKCADLYPENVEEQPDE